VKGRHYKYADAFPNLLVPQLQIRLNRPPVRWQSPRKGVYVYPASASWLALRIARRVSAPTWGPALFVGYEAASTLKFFEKGSGPWAKVYAEDGSSLRPERSLTGCTESVVIQGVTDLGA
jgi:hypothetical protein